LSGAKGQNREPGLQENSVRNFTGRQGQIPGKIFRKPAFKQVFLFPGKQANCFACVGTLLLTTKNPGCEPGEFHWYAKKT